MLAVIIFFIAFFLRFYKLTSNPSSLYWEEVALGYDAYSLLKTGSDHRGNPWPVVYINSYMDYKPPLYVYTAIPSIWLFGLNEFGIRFPSAFFGSLTVLVFYLLVNELFKDKISQYLNISISLMASFLLTISPWHLQFSRAAFEANLALFIFSLAVLLFYKALKNKIYLPFSSFCFVLTLYTYHGARVFTPLFIALLLLIYWRKLWHIKSIAIISLILGLILTSPLIKEMNKIEVRQRFQETSAFATLDPIVESNQKIEEDGTSRLSKLIHHRFLEYSRIFLNNYFTYFNGRYLFLSGDENPRHSTQEFGELYHWELVTLILGIIILLKNIKRKSSLLIIGWLLLAPIPGAITKTNPHSLRTILSLPAFIIVSAIGLTQIIKVIKNIKLPSITHYSLLITLFLLLFTEFILYLHFYYSHYPKIHSDQWQYGYKEAILYIKNNQEKYNSIYLTEKYGRAYMYYLFFNQLEPTKIQAFIEPFKTDPNIRKLDKVNFGDKETVGEGELVIGGPDEKRGKLLKTINLLDGTPVFKIWEK